MSDEIKRIAAILEKNKEKEFVRRILDPDNSPSIDMGDGMRGTHFMASGEADGKYYVFPTIVMIDGELQKMDTNKAFRHALDTGEAIEFDSADEANEFSKNYKKIWEK